MATIYKPYKCPQCEEPARGTLEVLSGVAEMSFEDDGTGTCDGETDIWWDEQKTVTAKKSGRVKMICPAAHEWWARITETEEN